MALATYRVEGGVIVEARIGVGAVESQPRRFAEAEALLRGKAPGAQTLSAAVECVSAAVQPIEQDPEAIAYKRDVVRAMVRRALEAAESER